MSLFSSIGKVLKKAVSYAPSILGLATGGVGGIVAGSVLDSVVSGSASPARNIVSTAPSSVQLPNIKEPGIGGTLARILPGGETGYLSRGKYKTGRLSGNAIPHGYHEKMSPQGMIYLVKSRRRRGITARDLQTYRRVHRTLKTYAKKYK